MSVFVQAQFYNEQSFQQFNIFNGFFYNGESGKRCLQDFLCSGDVKHILLISDPPFGGLVSAIGSTIRMLWGLAGSGTCTFTSGPTSGAIGVFDNESACQSEALGPHYMQAHMTVTIFFEF